ncbi:MAG: ABC transporter permease [Planctomycetaceae bacterium]|nr:ABC transporter permease [Planctomycetaceae bacterium]
MLLRFFLKTLRYEKGLHLATMCGVLIATAVLTGAFLIGDSMPQSLRRMTLDRLGQIGSVLQSERFFSENMVTDGVPLIFLRAAARVANPSGQDSEPFRQTGGVQLWGISDRFAEWHDPQNHDAFVLRRNDAVMNERLARQLGIAKPGSTVTLFFEKPSPVPSESALGHRQDTMFRIQVRVRGIVPNTGAGAFSLRSDQQEPANLFVSLDWLQQELKVPGKVNMTAVEHGSRHGDAAALPITLDDLGVILQRTESGTLHIKSANMLFTKPQEQAVQKALASLTEKKAAPSLLYLAESIRYGERETPYSTVLAADMPRKCTGEEMILNRWTADDLGVAPGDTVTLNYFKPESLHGKTAVDTVTLRVAEVVEMSGFAGDSAIVPELPGLTDSMKIGEWNPPFPFDLHKIRDKDEHYWEQYRATPKAFVPLETGRKLWGSRFGTATALSLEEVSPEEEERIRCTLAARLDPAIFGLVTIPVREQGLAAASGTTPFSILFLSFSFFIIVSALMLLAMLFRLTAEVQSKHLGLLLTLGFTPRQLTRFLFAEGIVLSLAGGFLGVPFGIAYARLMVHGLNTWWVGSIVSPFLRLSVRPMPLISGGLLGVAVSVPVILLTARTLKKQTPLSLLRGTEQVRLRGGNHSHRGAMFLFFPCMILLAFSGFVVDARFQTPFFFGSAVFCLLMSLYFVRILFLHQVTPSAKGQKTATLFRLAVSNASRARGRSLLTVGLLATSTFLIVATGIFRIGPIQDVSRKFSGTGGFALIAETESPVFYDLNTEEGREELGIREEEETWLRSIPDSAAVSFRVRDGDRAGCLNLYKPNVPRILGVPETLEGFDGIVPWKQRFFKTDVWHFMRKPVTLDPDGVRRVPVILENNTAMYSFHLYGGVGETLEITDNQGNPLRLEVAGLLSNSIFQGEILMSEENFLDLFPDVRGYRYFLVSLGQAGNDAESVDRAVDHAGQLLYRLLGDHGLTLETTRERLTRYFAVQNTYLSAFQSLGGLGLLLGTLGLGIVQIRNILVRRKELAVMSAVGFSTRRLILLLFLESFYLLMTGLFLGLFTALFAVLPQIRSHTLSIPVGSMLLVFLTGAFSSLAAAAFVLRIPISGLLREDR